VTGDEDDSAERTTVVKAQGHASDHSSVTAVTGWRRFLFSDLAKVSRAEARLVDKVESLLPGGAGQTINAVSGRLGSLFELPVDLGLEHVHALCLKELRRTPSAPAFLASISCLPHQPRLFIEVELALAHAAVDVLLGGTGEPIPFRSLTDIENGVVAFVLLEALRAMAPSINPSLPRLRLEGLLRGIEEAVHQLEGEAYAGIVQLRCRVGAHAGLVRIVLPASMLELTAASARRARPGGLRAPLALLSTWLRAEIGRVELRAADLAALAPGDVVVTDGLSFRCDRREGGSAELRVGMGQAGWMDADVALDGDTYAATITSFHFDTPRAREQSTDPPDRTVPEEMNMGESRREGAELLSDIMLQIVIELARVPITADQVVGLHVGQVLELHRGPGAPVALSANGKVIAQGELVEVEGQLGVRILSTA
jgi:type III secretion system YscQ/HrcQ family protein